MSLSPLSYAQYRYTWHKMNAASNNLVLHAISKHNAQRIVFFSSNPVLWPSCGFTSRPPVAVESYVKAVFQVTFVLSLAKEPRWKELVAWSQGWLVGGVTSRARYVATPSPVLFQFSECRRRCVCMHYLLSGKIAPCLVNDFSPCLFVHIRSTWLYIWCYLCLIFVHKMPFIGLHCWLAQLLAQTISVELSSTSSPSYLLPSRTSNSLSSLTISVWSWSPLFCVILPGVYFRCCLGCGVVDRPWCAFSGTHFLYSLTLHRLVNLFILFLSCSTE